MSQAQTAKNIRVPAKVFHELSAMARKSRRSSAKMIAELVENRRVQEQWQKNLDELCRSVQNHQRGRPPSQKKILAATRKARRQIFQAEYAHLY